MVEERGRGSREGRKARSSPQPHVMDSLRQNRHNWCQSEKTCRYFDKYLCAIPVNLVNRVRFYGDFWRISRPRADSQQGGCGAWGPPIFSPS